MSPVLLLPAMGEETSFHVLDRLMYQELWPGKAIKKITVVKL